MSALAKSAKSKRKPESAAETLDQIESLGDRVGNWIAQNAILVLGVAVLILVLAGGYGFVNSRRSEARQAASAALAGVETNYLRAMGGSPDSLVIDEPANPETARRVREQYVGLYQEVANQYPGTIESMLAILEAGALMQQLDRADDAIRAWQGALDATTGHDAVRGLLLERVASAHEAAGRWPEAAAAHEAAANLSAFPVRHLALAEAARCYAEAGNTAKALELFDRLESEAPEYQVAPHVQARMSELRAAR